MTTIIFLAKKKNKKLLFLPIEATYFYVYYFDFYDKISSFSQSKSFSFFRFKIHFPFYFLIISLLIGCTNVQKNLPQSSIREEISQIEKNPITYPINKNSIYKQRHLLQLYTLIDDQPGQLQTLLTLSNILFQTGQQQKAKLSLKKAEAIAKRLNINHYNYQLTLLTARIEQNLSKFQLAIQYAETPLQKALALAYLGENTKALQLISNRKPIDLFEAVDLGFIHYRFARKYYDHKVAKRAFLFYQDADYTPGIVDCLMLLGIIAQKSKRITLAINYYQRALAVSKALNDEFRIHAIEKKLQDL
jgi:hypothetical protein